MQCQAVLTKSSGECVESGLKKGTYFFFLDLKNCRIMDYKMDKNKRSEIQNITPDVIQLFLVQPIFEFQGMSFK